MLLRLLITLPPGGQLGIRGVEYAVYALTVPKSACFLLYTHCYPLVSSGSELSVIHSLPVHAFYLPLLLSSFSYD